MGGLVSLHMFIGMALIPPVVLKLATSGYRFIRYYTGSPTYRTKGAPRLPLRLLGVGVRGMLVVAAVGGGVALGLSLLPAINSWHA
jgi:hypothetical protein